MRRLPLITALAFLLALAVGACGGGGGGGNEEDQIAAAIQTAATTTSASNCTELETQRFLEQTEFRTGQAAIAECKRSDPANDADSVAVSNVSIDGETATADAAVKGSVFDGQTLVIALVKDGDQWKLDHVDDIKGFDGAQFARAFAAAVEAGNSTLTAEQTRCLTQKLAAAPSDTLKAAVLSGDGDKLAALISGC
jgi:hypothetical protein